MNLFLFLEALEGRRWVDVTQRRTKVDWAYQIKELVDERYPEAEQIVGGYGAAKHPHARLPI